MATKVMKDVVTWLKQWFYTEDEVDTITGGLQTQINNKADSSTVSTLTTTVNGKADKNHTQATSTITNTTALNNILAGESTTLTLTDQAKINSAINDVIGTLKSIELIKVVTNKGTASASTMNKLYIEVGTNKTDIYYTSQNGNTYSWKKLDTDVLDDLSIGWSDVQNKPTTFPPSDHAHGQITKDGKVTTTTSTVGNVVVTDSNGVVKVINKLPSGNVTHQNISGKSDKTATLGTTVTLVNKGETNEGCIIFETIS